VSRYYNIIEAMEKNYGYNIGDELREYVQNSPSAIRCASRKPDACGFRLVDWEVKGCYTKFGQRASGMIFDVIVGCKMVADIIAEGIHRFDEIVLEDLDLRFVLDLTTPGGRVWPPRIVPAKYERLRIPFCHSIYLNEYFEPVLITNEDYDRFAALMLGEYCKKALLRPTSIDGDSLARAMGLRVRDVRFAFDKDIKGRTYFEEREEALLDDDGNVRLVRVKPGQILINTNRVSLETDRNNTIIHECVHVFKDKYFFLLQRMAGANVEMFTSRTASGSKTGITVVDRMEDQAERLPAFIMMPAETTKAFIEDELEELGGFLSPTNMQVITTRLSMKFGVSISMARNRMIELGYPEAKGVFQYVSGKKVPSHGCSAGWLEDAVFQISMEKATQLFDNNPEFAEAVAKRQYIYVDGFYVISSTRFVRRNDDESLTLKQEALQHMEQCCVAFSKEEKPVKHVPFRSGMASRSMTKAERAQLGLKPINLPVVEKCDDDDSLFRDEEKWDKLYDDMHDTIPCALDAILAMTGLSKRGLADRLGIAKSNVDKWYKTGRIPKGQLAALCLELELRGDIGNKLAVLSRIRWDSGNKVDTALRMFIANQARFSIVTAEGNMVARNFGVLYPRAELTSVGA